ncbi:unnamed protein product, partial [Vitis vinifera]|uniref:Uncharacterized protein n=1 Tax=Vitis vinifera TaxID=29760 RepID=D7U729_VITVI
MRKIREKEKEILSGGSWMILKPSTPVSASLTTVLQPTPPPSTLPKPSFVPSSSKAGWPTTLLQVANSPPPPTLRTSPVSLMVLTVMKSWIAAAPNPFALAPRSSMKLSPRSIFPLLPSKSSPISRLSWLMPSSSPPAPLPSGCPSPALATVSVKKFLFFFP